MKKKIFLLAALVSCTVMVMADEYSGTCGENLTWNLTDGVLTISGTGDMTNWNFYSPWHSYSSTITTVTIGNSITSIGNYAFYGCTGLTSITIPNSVTNIGDYAFARCEGLTSITIPNSVTNIGDYAFARCTGLTSITIPNSVTNIGDNAFARCTGLTSITIPNSVTSIGPSAFALCIGLTSITIPNSVTNIGNGTFARCTGLTSITIPNSVTNIGNYAFSGCESLTSITIPNSVTNIGNYAFSGCESLTSITIPNSVTNIGDNAFYNCTGLTSIICEAQFPPTIGGPVFDPNSFPLIFVPCGTLETYRQSWSDYARVIHLLPNPYTITGNAQNGTISIPRNITICDLSVQIEAIANLGYHFIQWSDGVKDNPRTIELVQDTTFTAEFAIDKSGTCGDDNALLWEYDSKTKTLTISGAGALDSNYTYGVEAPGEMEHLVISEGITSIGSGAFQNETSLVSIVLCSTLLSVGDSAFAGCRRLEDISLYASRIPDIAANSFANVGNKQYIYLYVPDGRERSYQRDTYWGAFDIQVKSAESITTPMSDVKVVPAENTAEMTWPAVTNASSYDLEITKDGVVFCILKFDASGRLTGITFSAPSVRNNEPQEQMSGFRFTVTGLNSGTQYGYSVAAKNTSDVVIDTKSGSFITLGGTGIDEITNHQSQFTNQKILHDGQIYFLRDGKVFDLTGRKLK